MLHDLSSILIVCLSMLTVLSTSIHAEIWKSSKPEDKDWSSPQIEDKDWNFTVGGGVMYGPKYEGSNNYEVKAFPNVSVEYKNGMFFAGIFDGIGTCPIQGENYKVGASIGPALGRDEDDDKENLRGMGDIDVGVVVNLMGEYSYGPFQVSGKVSKSDQDYGTTASVDFGSMFPITDKLMAMVSVESTWVDADHMNTYFGISSVQSASSGYGRYEAGSGFKSISVNVGTFYSMTEHWDVMFMVNGDELLGDAADSPLTKEKFQLSAFLFTIYKF